MKTNDVIQSYARRRDGNKMTNNTLMIQGAVLNQKVLRQKTTRAKGINDLTESGIVEVHGIKIQANRR